MAYSTQAQLENNVEMIEQTFTDSSARATWTAERIALADKIIDVDLSKYVTLTSADETTPVINLLSQYKAAEMALRRMIGIQRRETENDDISDWKRLYDELLAKIIEGTVLVQLSDGTDISTSVGTFSNTARPDIRPHQGYDTYGEFLNNDDMEEIMGTPDEDIYT